MVTRKEIVSILMSRDGLTRSEAISALKEARLMVAAGMDPEEVLQAEFGLEPDYIFELLE